MRQSKSIAVLLVAGIALFLRTALADSTAGTRGSDGVWAAALFDVRSRDNVVERGDGGQLFILDRAKSKK